MYFWSKYGLVFLYAECCEIWRSNKSTDRELCGYRSLRRINISRFSRRAKTQNSLSFHFRNRISHLSAFKRLNYWKKEKSVQILTRSVPREFKLFPFFEILISINSIIHLIVFNYTLNERSSFSFFHPTIDSSFLYRIAQRVLLETLFKLRHLL